MIEDLAGQLIGGRYRIRELVGIGGMDSTVWKAWQTGTERVVAVKVLPAAEEAAAKRFARGARIAANLNHPNCTVVHDYGRSDDGKLFLVMEYLTGQVLQEILGPEGMSAADTIHVADQVLQALEHAHGQRAVHRDLKPDNLFLSRKNDDPLHVKILDFGIAKYVEEDPDNPSGEDAPSDGFEDLVTEQRQVCGTPQYMAPEQVVGARIDGRTDLYSLAVVMYRMLTGRLPFDGKTRYELYQKHLQEAPKPFHDVRPDLVFPDRLELIVLKTLSKRPDQRFQSAAEMRKALASVEVHDERQRRGVRPRVSLKHTSPQESGSPSWGGSDRDTDPEGAAGVIVSSAVEETVLPASPTVLPGGMWTLSQPVPDGARGPSPVYPNAPPPLPSAIARSRSSMPDVESAPALPPRATGPVPDVRPARVSAQPAEDPRVDARKSQDVRRSLPEDVARAPFAPSADARIPTPPAAAKLPTPALAPGKNTSTNLLSDAVMRHPAGRSSLAVAPEVPRSTETEPNRAREAGEKRRRRLGVIAVLAGAFLIGVGGVALTMQVVGDEEDAPSEGSSVAPAPITTESKPAAVTANKVAPPEPAPSKPPEPIKEPTPTVIETTTAGTLAGRTLSEVPVAPAPTKVAIKIDSVPPGAMVSEGLAILGPTPLSIALAPGRHVLSLERAGFVNAIVEIDASSDATAPVERKLVLVPTRVTPQTPPIRTPPPQRQPTEANKLLHNLTPEVKDPPKQDPPKVEAPKQEPPKNPQVKLLDDKGTGTTDPSKKPTIKLLEDDGAAPKKPQVKVLDE